MAEEKQRKPSDHSYDHTIQFRKMLSPQQRTREAIITSVLWVIYGYLWLPVISLVAWYYGINFAFETVLRAGGPDALILILIQFSIAFLVILLVIVSWSGFQYSKFRGKKERRNRVQALDPEQERELWQISEVLQTDIKSAQVQTISLGSDGRIKSIV